MTDISHEIIEREIRRLNNKLMNLETEIWSLKDAFFMHTHVPEDPDKPKETGIPWDKIPEGP